MSGDSEITITYFINPNLFFYKKLSSSDLLRLRSIENDLVKYREEHPHAGQNYSPETGNLVAVLDSERNKWFRAQIDWIYSSNNVLVWAIDYGEPLVVTRNSILPVKDETLMKRIGVKIYTGGIDNCFPAKMNSNRIPPSKEATSNWSTEAIKQFAEIIKRFDSFVFKNTRQLDEHVFGELQFKNQDKYCSVGQIFNEMAYALNSIDDLKKLKTINYKRYEKNDSEKFGQTSNLFDSVNLKAIMKQEPSSSHVIEEQQPGHHLHSNTKTVNGPHKTNNISENTSNRIHDVKFSSSRGFKNNLQHVKRNRNREEKVLSTLKDRRKETHRNNNCVQFENRPIFVYNQKVEEYKNSDDICCFKEEYLELLKTGPYLRETYAFAWPHLSHGYSLIVADLVEKSDVYIPVICSRIDAIMKKEKRPTTVQAIILCASEIVAHDIVSAFKLYLKIMEHNKSNTVLEARVNMKTSLLNGCLILVATPPALVSIMENSEQAIDFKELPHFVIDEFSQITESFQDDLIKIRGYGWLHNKNCQVVITTRNWDKILTGIAKREKIANSLVLIGYRVSLAAYEFVMNDTLPKQIYSSYANRANVLIDLIKKNRHERTIVFFNSYAEMEEIVEVLGARRIDHLTFTEKTSAIDIEYIMEWFTTNTSAVLLTTLSQLNRRPICTAAHIIHFSVPRKFKDFSQCHMASIDTYADYARNKGPQPTSKIIFAREESTDKCDSELHMYLRSMCFGDQMDHEISVQQDEEFSEISGKICKSWLLFGKCAKQRRNQKCAHRHTIIKLDIPMYPYCRQSHIQFSISKVHSPVQFEVRILAYRNNDKRDWKDETSKFLPQFEKSYSVKRTKRQFNREFEVGQFGVVYYDSKPRRVQILKITDQYNVEVSFMDIPGKLTCESKDIQYLMEEYRNQNDIVLCIGGVVPNNNYLNWHSISTTFARHILMEAGDGNKNLFESTVLFHLNGLIMVDDLIRISEPNDMNYTPISFKQMLMAKHAAADRTGVENVLACYSKLENDLENTAFKDGTLINKCSTSNETKLDIAKAVSKSHCGSDLGTYTEKNGTSVLPTLKKSDDSLSHTGNQNHQMAQISANEDKVKSTEPHITPIGRPLTVHSGRRGIMRRYMESKLKQSSALLTTPIPDALPVPQKVSSDDSNSPPKLGDDFTCNKMNDVMSSTINYKKLPEADDSSLNGNSSFSEISAHTENSSNKENNTNVIGNDFSTLEISCLSNRLTDHSSFEEIPTPLKYFPTPGRISKRNLINSSSCSSSETINITMPYRSESRASSHLRGDQLFEPHLKRDEHCRYLRLKFDTFQNVRVASFFYPSELYVQLVNGSRRYELFDEIDKFTKINDLKPLEDMKEKYCLAKFKDGYYYRCANIGISCEKDDQMKMSVRCLDSGLMENRSVTDVYELPPYLLTYIAFQAIPCRLVGIVPQSCVGKWTHDLCDKIYDNIIEKFNDKNIFAMPVRHLAHTEVSSYSIVLVECTNDGPIKINDRLVYEKYAEYDEATKYFIEKTGTSTIFNDAKNVNAETKCIESDNSSDISENWDHLNEPSYTSKPTPDSDYAHNTSDEDNFDIQFTEENLAELFPELRVKKNAKLIAEKDIPSKPLGPQLSHIAKMPQVEWEQKSDQIKLTILASDVIEYDLHVTDKTLHLCYEKDNEAYSVVMTFFGFILPEYTKHEIRGLNIIVKLRKIINFYNWPRLLKCKDNNRWLKIKYDTISVEEENKSEGIPQNNRYSSDDTDDNEEENSKFANKVFEL